MPVDIKMEIVKEFHASGYGEEEVVDADAEVVAEHVAEEADADAEDDNVAVAEQGGGERHEGGAN